MPVAIGDASWQGVGFLLFTVTHFYLLVSILLLLTAQHFCTSLVWKHIFVFGLWSSCCFSISLHKGLMPPFAYKKKYLLLWNEKAFIGAYQEINSTYRLTELPYLIFPIASWVFDIESSFSTAYQCKHWFATLTNISLACICWHWILQLCFHVSEMMTVLDF